MIHSEGLEIVELDPSEAAETWDEIISGLKQSHILQTREWAGAKQDVGWEPHFLIWQDQDKQVSAAALVLQRTIRFSRLISFHVQYCPRGPLLDWENEGLRRVVVNGLINFAKKHRVIFIKIDPEVKVGVGYPGQIDAEEDNSAAGYTQELIDLGWRRSNEQVQFRNTIWIDLTGKEGDWLAKMKQKTRYNLRLAERKGITVRNATKSELPQLYRIYTETSVRDGFVIRPQSYYLNLWNTFLEKRMALPLVAEFDGQIVGGLILFMFGKRAWYLYGMSKDIHREKMPNYFLQLEAMRFAKAAGCEIYDLWGAPDELSDGDALKGVYRFKEGLGGKVIRTIGAYDFPVQKGLYFVYTKALPKILRLMRRKRVAQTREEMA